MRCDILGMLGFYFDDSAHLCTDLKQVEISITLEQSLDDKNETFKVVASICSRYLKMNDVL